MTVFAAHPLYLDGVLLGANLLIFQLPRTASGIPLPSNASTSTISPSTSLRLPPLPALTTYRAHMMLMTVLAILAVDFPVFPRSLVKCETFGASLVCFLCFHCNTVFDFHARTDGFGSWVIRFFAGCCFCDSSAQGSLSSKSTFSIENN